MTSFVRQAGDFGAVRGDVASSSSDEEEEDERSARGGGRLTGATTRRTGAVPRIEIKPPSEEHGGGTSAATLSSFSFAPPPRAKAVSDGGAFVERASGGGAGIRLEGDSAREVANAMAAPSAVRAPARPPRGRENVPRATASKTKTVAQKPRAVAVDPYDMLDAIVGGPPKPKQPPKARASKPKARAPSPAPSADYHSQGPISPRSGGGSAPISPRGTGSSFAADSAFFEELAQISLPDSDTINPKREFARGLELFDANKLSEALFAFVAAAVNAVHSGDEVVFQCASYATACKILRDATTLVAANPKECARLTRHLVALPNIEERHRRSSLRFASAKNFKAGNAGTAATMINALIAISPPETSSSLYGMLKQCQDSGLRDINVPEDEDARKMCAATLNSIPNTQNGMTCRQCGALHSTEVALETGQCVICRSSLTQRLTPPNESWMW